MNQAIVVVSMGTSYKGGIEKDIAFCEHKIAEYFKNYDFYRAFTSEASIKKLKETEGMKVALLNDLLSALKTDGYEEVIVQPLYLLAGEAYDHLVEQIEMFKESFKYVGLGRPLLSEIEDYTRVKEAIVTHLPLLKSGEVVVLMGHGTMHEEAQRIYKKLERYLEEEELPIHIATLIGHPNIKETIESLRKARIKKVYLMPFLVVAGGHVLRDMAGDHKAAWQSILGAEGFEVEVILRGLGSNEIIADQFAKHARAAVKVE